MYLLLYLMFRCIPHEKSSQLRCQASLVWRAELGTNAPEEFSTLTAARQSRVELSKLLDGIHDRFKQNALLSVLKPTRVST